MAGDRTFDLLRTLDCFVRTVHVGSMSDAARRMGLTQSAVSQQIINLESALGAKLIDRHLRPLRATSAGLELLDRAEAFLDEGRRILSSTRNFRDHPLPKLRLSVLSSLAGVLTPSIVHTLRREVPIQNIVVSSGLANTHRVALLNRETDIAITSDLLLDMDPLERHDVLREPFVLILPADADVAVDSLRDLAERLPLVRYHSNSPIGMRIEAHLQRQKLSIPHWCEFDAAEAVVAMVASGNAWAITSPLHVLQGVRDWSRIRCVPLPRPGMSRLTMVVARRGELKGLAAVVANISRKVVRDTVLPALCERLPFLIGTVGTTGAALLEVDSASPAGRGRGEHGAVSAGR